VARSKKTMSEAFLPLRFRRSRTGRPLAAEDKPSIQAIWQVVSLIPRGQVATYGAVARAAGLPGRARLTGYALRVAPPEMHLPWHRVVGAGGRIAFPKSSNHHREQSRILRSEGVAIKDGRVARAAFSELEKL
jgi:methylated-DNA-protein-cysteine methyltransferase related protein